MTRDVSAATAVVAGFKSRPQDFVVCEVWGGVCDGNEGNGKKGRAEEVYATVGSASVPALPTHMTSSSSSSGGGGGSSDDDAAAFLKAVRASIPPHVHASLTALNDAVSGPVAAAQTFTYIKPQLGEKEEEGESDWGCPKRFLTACRELYPHVVQKRETTPIGVGVGAGDGSTNTTITATPCTFYSGLLGNIGLPSSDIRALSAFCSRGAHHPSATGGLLLGHALDRGSRTSFYKAARSKVPTPYMHTCTHAHMHTCIPYSPPNPCAPVPMARNRH